MNNVIPGDIARDPEKLQALVNHMYSQEPVLPGMEEWVPEDETPDAETMDELGVSTLYRIVNEHGKVERSNTSTAFNKPYYSTLRGAKSALTYLRRRADGKFRLQKGEVLWEEL